MAKRVESERVVRAYRATGARIGRETWCEVQGSGTVYACGLGVVCLADKHVTRDEATVLDWWWAATALDLTVSYVRGFASGFDYAGLGGVCVASDRPGGVAQAVEISPGRSELEEYGAEVATAEMRAGIEDGRAAYWAAKTAQDRADDERLIRAREAVQ